MLIISFQRPETERYVHTFLNSLTNNKVDASVKQIQLMKLLCIPDNGWSQLVSSFIGDHGTIHFMYAGITHTLSLPMLNYLFFLHNWAFLLGIKWIIV